jgi:SpoVK/Ycf46/Vps4 family AAA+-type ATPase
MKDADHMTQKGIFQHVALPRKEFALQWDRIIIPPKLKEQLLAQAVLEFTLRGKVSRTSVPLHGIMLLVGPPGTGKTSLARGLANRVAESISGKGFRFVEVDPHALASSALGRSQQAVRDLLEQTIVEFATQGPLIVLLDEVETIVADRRRLSLEANPVDVHRATDAALASLDHLAASHDDLLFVATSNFPEALDDAFVSRADFVVLIDRPDRDACRAIVADTLEELARPWPRLKALTEPEKLDRVAMTCVGLDGRQIRKAVINACAASKETALDPGRLRIEDILRSIEHAKERVK